MTSLPRTALATRLETLRPDFAREAQKVVDGWEQDEDGEDEELGQGGICDRVANAMAGLAARAISRVKVTDGGHEGDDHAFIVVYNAKEAYAVDIAPEVYETGGGYRWRKRKDARIAASDVAIWAVPREHVTDD